MGHQPRPCEVAIGLGGHDLGVAAHAAALFRAGLFPIVVFTGATRPTTGHRFPRGEARHYREHAIELGVAESAILVEPHATNTGANFALSREVLAGAGLRPCHRVPETGIRRRAGVPTRCRARLRPAGRTRFYRPSDHLASTRGIMNGGRGRVCAIHQPNLFPRGDAGEAARRRQVGGPGRRAVLSSRLTSTGHGWGAPRRSDGGG